jgi:hypothetical protein
MIRARLLDCNGNLFCREYASPAFVLTTRRGFPTHCEMADAEVKLPRKRAARLLRMAKCLGVKYAEEPLSLPRLPEPLTRTEV